SKTRTRIIRPIPVPTPGVCWPTKALRAPPAPPARLALKARKDPLALQAPLEPRAPPAHKARKDRQAPREPPERSAPLVLCGESTGSFLPPIPPTTACCTPAPDTPASKTRTRIIRPIPVPTPGVCWPIKAPRGQQEPPVPRVRPALKARKDPPALQAPREQ